MRRLREAIPKKLRIVTKPLIQIASIPARISLLVCETSVKHKKVILPQPLYLPDISSCEYDITMTFRHIWWDKNRVAKGAERHTDKWVPEVVSKLKKKCWHKCITCKGYHFLVD